MFLTLFYIIAPCCLLIPYCSTGACVQFPVSMVLRRIKGWAFCFASTVNSQFFYLLHQRNQVEQTKVRLLNQMLIIYVSFPWSPLSDRSLCWLIRLMVSNWPHQLFSAHLFVELTSAKPSRVCWPLITIMGMTIHHSLPLPYPSPVQLHTDQILMCSTV